MKEYASFEATHAKLLELGFLPTDGETYDSPNNDKYGIPVVQVYIYQCNYGYYCVDVYGDYRAPIIWDGPKAIWDRVDSTKEFIEWLNSNYPNWA